MASILADRAAIHDAADFDRPGISASCRLTGASYLARTNELTHACAYRIHIESWGIVIMNIRTMVTISAALFSTAGIGQELTPAAPTLKPEPASQVAVPMPAVVRTAMIVGAPEPSVLRAGTEVALKTSEPLTTKEKKLRVGQRFQMEIAESVTLNGQTVIPVGSPAIGEITDVRNKGMWGKSGRINARALYVRVNGRQIRLTGQIDDKGVTGTAGVVASIALIPLAGFFTTGTSAVIPTGSPMKAFLDEDLTVAFAEAVPAQPMLVVPVVGPAPSTPPVPK